MNNEKIIELVKFHCDASLKNLLNLRLAEENLTKEAINEINEAYSYLKENLIASLTNNSL